ncbi:conserved hypothetical protein [Culex quinquefasciatus]|uniref:Uncharacterized protein n=1 Tax=Culex quinquefasciatus TaxID=7176 RepID=B0X4N7_CULQU|nr:conserved hypothetical protein [Culex quinquefasciatus]|eukprot:XP_001864609.1 conserved hypothetical protein [Culex quinquefasciatus]
MAMLTENATGPGEEEDDDDDETEVGVDLGIAGVAEAGPSPHEEDNLIILHELDLKGVGEDDEDEDEEEEEEEDDEEDDEDQPMVEEQEQVVGQPQQVEEAVADGPVMCSASDLDGFDGIQAIKMETDSIFDSGDWPFKMKLDPKMMMVDQLDSSSIILTPATTTTSVSSAMAMPSGAGQQLQAKDVRAIIKPESTVTGMVHGRPATGQLITRIKIEGDDGQKVHVVTSGSDNLTRVIESVAGNYGSTAAAANHTQQLLQQHQHQQLLQQVPQHIKLEMDGGGQSQQQQPKFIITRQIGNKIPITVTSGPSGQILQHQGGGGAGGAGGTVTATLQKPIQLQKIIMSSSSLQPQRPRLPLQRAQLQVQPQQTQSQQRFQQKFVTNQLIRGQNAAIINSVQQLQQVQQQQQQQQQQAAQAQAQAQAQALANQQAQQAAATVGANVVIGPTPRKTRVEITGSGTVPAIAATAAASGSIPGSSAPVGPGGSRRGGRTSSTRLPPGAVNLERSYQICQAVIQNSPNRHQLRAQLKPPQAFLASSNSNSSNSSNSNGSSSSGAGGGGAGSGKDEPTSFGGAIVGNKVGPRLVNPKRIISTVGRQPSSIVVRHVYTTAGQSNPGTISIISTSQQQQQQQQQQFQPQQTQQPQPVVQQRIMTAAEAAAELQHAQIISVSGTGTNATGTIAVSTAGPVGANFGGKYVLVQRTHIGDIVTPRAASAPPTQNQQQQQSQQPQQQQQVQIIHHPPQQLNQQIVGPNPGIQAVTRRGPTTHVISYGDIGIDTTTVAGGAGAATTTAAHILDSSTASHANVCESLLRAPRSLWS